MSHGTVQYQALIDSHGTSANMMVDPNFLK